MKKMLLIVNPCSGKKKVKNNLFDIINIFDTGGFEVTVRLTAYGGHATELAKEYSESGEYACIVCCGGDGTLNETLNGIAIGDNSVPVGYIPSGSTNDFAASMNIDPDAIAAAMKIINGRPLPIDIGKFNDRYFSYIASFGAFTSVSYNTSQQFKNVFGHLAYVLEGMKDITAIRPYRVRAEADGKVFENDYIFGAVTNSTSVAGIVKIDSEFVDMNDGLFEVTLVRKPKNIIELHEIVQGCFASDFSNKMFDFFKASDIRFDTGVPITWSVDGERAEAESMVEVKNLHNYINFIR